MEDPRREARARAWIHEQGRNRVYEGGKPLFLADLPSAEWIEFVLEMAATILDWQDDARREAS